jgi:hypothetical protein
MVTSMSARVEVHFHQQDEASVFLETTQSGDEQLYEELLLFAAFALRQMSNLGKHPTAVALAYLLSSVDTEFLDELSYSTNDDVGMPRIIAYPGHGGRKQFIATIIGSRDDAQLKMEMKGFGLLARGAGYYAPMSVQILMRYLSEQRSDDDYWLSILAAVANACGRAYAAGQLSLGSTGRVAANIVREQWVDRKSGNYPIGREEWPLLLARMYLGALGAQEGFVGLVTGVSHEVAGGSGGGPDEDAISSIMSAAIAYQLGLIVSIIMEGPYIRDDEREDFAKQLVEHFCAGTGGGARSQYIKYWKGGYATPASRKLNLPGRMLLSDVVRILRVRPPVFYETWEGKECLRPLDQDTYAKAYTLLGDPERALDVLIGE